MSMQKSLLGISIALLFSASAYAADDQGSGELHFKGEIVNAPCEIHPDDINQSIDLGMVTTKRINTDKHSTAKAVNIRLINCDLANSDNGSGDPISKVAVTFDSDARTTEGTLMLDNTSTGEATGVGVMILNKDQTPVTLGQPTSDINLLEASSSQTLNFFAWMQVIDASGTTPATPGAVTANATYVLDYK
ncbi:type 1 fimbrial protein [Superficieibacter electus]|uniref:Type 1 fimbrial protein n=1 Tax=Superficieibacter electus TaxID=2022662 RepID=A0A2P5GR91_9ENTR|nr:fimbrial protein [Superficieibacter electus]POP42870.1 type 1 fimbrial protein [Superficieibacter electus]POP49075.1 type 1 fimbrial protein [Superficieibacter electus]